MTTPTPPADLSAAQPPANANERLALPGPQHARLAPLEGDWRVRLSMWPEAGAEPVVSTDLTARREWLIGGRFLQETTRGTLGGEPYERVGLFTHHALLQRFEYLTLDNLDTGFMRAESLNDAPGNVCLYGSFVQAGMGQDVVGRVIKLRYVWHLDGADHSRMEMFVTPPAAPEFLLAEFVYTR